MEGISLLHKSNLWTPKDLDPSACLASFSEHKNMFEDDKIRSTRAESGPDLEVDGDGELVRALDAPDQLPRLQRHRHARHHAHLQRQGS